jgi:hypothetical protein
MLASRLLSCALLAAALAAGPRRAAALEAAAASEGSLETLLSTRRSCHGDHVATRAIRTRAEWEEAWRELTCDRSARAPAVDFATRLVLLAADAPGPTGCYGVRIVEVTPTAGAGYAVSVARTVPRADRACPMVVVRPAHAVSAPRVPGAVTFEWRTVRGDLAAAPGGAPP